MSRANWIRIAGAFLLLIAMLIYAFDSEVKTVTRFCRTLGYPEIIGSLYEGFWCQRLVHGSHELLRVP